MEFIGFIAFLATMTTGAAYVVFPSPFTLAATLAALGVTWRIIYGHCADDILIAQEAGAIVRFVTLRCIGNAATVTGIYAGCIAVMRVLFALFVEAPTP